MGALGRTRAKRSPQDETQALYVCEWTADGPSGVRALTAEGAAPPATLALSLSPQDAELIRRGDLAPSVAFMQGRLKTAGDNALLLDVLSWTSTSAFAKALSSLAG